MFVGKTLINHKYVYDGIYFKTYVYMIIKFIRYLNFRRTHCLTSRRAVALLFVYTCVPRSTTVLQLDIYCINLKQKATEITF